MQLLLVIFTFVYMIVLHEIAADTLGSLPQHIRLSEEKQLIRIICTSKQVPITACQFSWVDMRDSPKAGPILDLSQGHRTQANASHLSKAVINYWYNGRGLGDGDCGITMEVKGFKMWMVGCRAHADQQGWVYGWTDILAQTQDPIHTSVSPREAIIEPGGNVTFTIESKELKYQDCDVKDPNGLWFEIQHIRNGSWDGGHYIGSGLQNGECGFQFVNLTEKDSGPRGLYVRSSDGVNSHVVSIIVARPPKNPEMQIVYDNAYMQVKCKVRDSRPVANITWLLGDDVIRDDSLDESPTATDDSWIWPWNKTTIIQKVNRFLTQADNGKVLKCRVSHVGLEEPLEIQEMINIPCFVNNTSSHQDCNPQVIFTPDCEKIANKTTEGEEWEVMEAKAKATKEEAIAKKAEAEANKEVLRAQKMHLEIKKAELELEALQMDIDAKKTRAGVELESLRALARTNNILALNAQEQLEFERQRRALLLRKL